MFYLKETNSIYLNLWKPHNKIHHDCTSTNHNIYNRTIELHSLNENPDRKCWSLHHIKEIVLRSLSEPDAKSNFTDRLIGSSNCESWSLSFCISQQFKKMNYNQCNAMSLFDSNQVWCKNDRCNCCFFNAKYQQKIAEMLLSQQFTLNRVPNWYEMSININVGLVFFSFLFICP